jgi:hypothetical protein
VLPQLRERVAHRHRRHAASSPLAPRRPVVANSRRWRWRSHCSVLARARVWGEEWSMVVALQERSCYFCLHVLGNRTLHACMHACTHALVNARSSITDRSSWGSLFSISVFGISTSMHLCIWIVLCHLRRPWCFFKKLITAAWIISH